MKKYGTVLLYVMLVFILAGCGHEHEWVEADCENPRTCVECSETEGEALGHAWTPADCENPKMCETCGETEGEALGHDWQEGNCEAAEICAVCQEGRGEVPGHKLHGGEINMNSDGSVVYTGTCYTCGQEDASNTYFDISHMGKQIILGTWHGVAYSIDGGFTAYTIDEENTKGAYVVFYEDGTEEFHLYDIAGMAEWSFGYYSSMVAEQADIGENNLHCFHYDSNLFSMQLLITEDKDELRIQINGNEVFLYDSADVLYN